MQCPFCKAVDTRVVDSRLYDAGAQVRRRRECTECNHRFTTFERAELAMPQVLKSSGAPEPYDEQKLRSGMERALYKRPVSAERLDHAIQHITDRIRSRGERELASHHIGAWVMDELRDLDHIAFVRFASIYRKFEDVNAFREEIERLEKLPSAEARRSQLPLIEIRPEPSAGKR